MFHLEPFTNPRETVGAVLDRIMPAVEGRSVLIKPDWNARETPKASESTTVGFLAAVLTWLEQHGAASVTLGHSSLLTPPDLPYTSFSDLLKLAGGHALLEDFPHLRLRDLEVEPMRLQGGFLVPAAVAEADVLVSCVRLKTHSGTQIAVGTKGLMGLLPDSEHLRMHRDGLARLMAALAVAVPPSVTLVEADVGMEGEGPHHGSDVDCGYYLGGDDVFEVDALAAQLMGHAVDEVDHLAALGRLLDRAAPALPVALRRHVRDFQRPTGIIQATRAARVLPGDSCATCHLAASSVLDFVKANPTRIRTLAGLAKALYVDGVDLYMGHQPADRVPAKGRSLALGECSRGFAEAHGVPHIGGCPVRYHEVQDLLVEELS
jgi:uncharacterized protein (DUF362 family)